MKIDQHTKTITIEGITDEVPARNYLFIYLNATERKGWHIRKNYERIRYSTKSVQG